MSVDDFATTLAYLVRVCWSAAAGQLHLASIGDSAPPSPAQSLRGKSPATSSLQLKAGICAQQANGSVSAKVVHQNEPRGCLSSVLSACIGAFQNLPAFGEYL